MSNILKFVIIVILPLLSGIPIYYSIIYFNKRNRLKLFEIRAQAVADEICFRREYGLLTFELCCALQMHICKCQNKTYASDEIYQAYLEGNFREFVYLVFLEYAKSPTYGSNMTVGNQADILEYCIVTPDSKDFSHWWQPNYLKEEKDDVSKAGAYAFIAVLITIACMYCIVGFFEILMTKL